MVWCKANFLPPISLAIVLSEKHSVFAPTLMLVILLPFKSSYPFFGWFLAGVGGSVFMVMLYSYS